MYIGSELAAPTAAEDRIRRIRNRIGTLDFFPERFAVIMCIPETNIPVHRMSVDHFNVYFSVGLLCKTVGILRILYGGRDASQLIRNSLN